MSDEIANYQRRKQTKRQEITKLVRADLPKFKAEVLAIKQRLETTGFSTYQQFLEDRERLIIIRESCSTAAGDGFEVPQDSQFFHVWNLADQTCRLAVNQRYAERNKDMESRRSCHWELDCDERSALLDRPKRAASSTRSNVPAVWLSSGFVSQGSSSLENYSDVESPTVHHQVNIH